MSWFNVRPRIWGLLLAALVLFLVSGCSSMPAEEKVWQVMHLADVLQTAAIVDDPCYAESDPLTTALVGENPTLESVLAWGVGSALLHAGVTHLLERHEAPDWLHHGWAAVSIGTKARTVYHNHEIGVRPFGDNKRTPHGYQCWGVFD